MYRVSATFCDVPNKKRFTAVGIWLLACVSHVNSSSIMASIREKHEANPSSKGLRLSSESWLAVPSVLQDMLISIDDKLKSLDTYGYARKLASLDYSLEQLVRRLDNIEMKLGRLDTKFDLRMEKVQEVVVEKDIKEELSNEHLVRGMENLNERFNSKASFLEVKLNVRMDRISQKLDEMEKDLHSSVEEILERMVRNNERQVLFEAQVFDKLQNIEDHVRQQSNIKTQDFSGLEKRIGNVETKIAEHTPALEQSQSQGYSNTLLQEIATTTKQAVESSMQEMKSFVNGSSCLSGLTDKSFRALLKTRDYEENGDLDEKVEKLNAAVSKTLNLSETKFRKMDLDMELYTKKVIASVQELWESQDNQIGLLHESLRLSNETKSIFVNKLQELKEQLLPISTVQHHLANLSEFNLHKRLTDLRSIIDNSFATLLVAQNTFISTCHRIQMEESHVYNVLTDIVYEMRNRSIVDMQKIGERIAVANFQLGGKLNHVLEAIFLVGNVTKTQVDDNCNSNRSHLKFQEFVSGAVPREPTMTQHLQDSPVHRNPSSGLNHYNGAVSPNPTSQTMKAKNNEMAPSNPVKAENMSTADDDSYYTASETDY